RAAGGGGGAAALRAPPLRHRIGAAHRPPGTAPGEARPFTARRGPPPRARPPRQDPLRPQPPAGYLLRPAGEAAADGDRGGQVTGRLAVRRVGDRDRCQRPLPYPPLATTG